MKDYKLNIGGKQYKVQAEDESQLSEIAETIAMQSGAKKGGVPLAQRAGSAAIAGLPSAFGGTPKDTIQAVGDAAPAIGQFAMGATPQGRLAQFVGSVLGATGGEAVRQGINEGGLDVGGLRDEALLTAGVEGVTRGASGLLFNKARAGESVKTLGKQVGKIKEQIKEASKSNPDLLVDGTVIGKRINSMLDTVNDTTGAVGAKLKRFANKFIKKKTIDAGDLVELEDGLNDALKYDGSNIRNKATEKIGKTIRSEISDMVDDFAKKLGYENFKQLNLALSKSMKTSSRKGLGLLREGGLGSLVGGSVGLASGDPTLGLMAGAGTIGLTDDLAKQALFKFIEKTGLGRTATLSASELLRTSERKQ